MNIFKALKLNIGEEAIRFCRRIGEKKENPRPMVVGFWAEGDKCLLLRNAKHLDKTIFKEVTVGPDLTKKQRAEEAEMREEADRRNREELTEDDASKNLKWTVVGDRGKKSLIKTVAREGERGTSWRRREDQGGETRTHQKRGPGGAVVGGRYQLRGERVSETGRKRRTPERAAEKDREKEKTTEVVTESERESSSESETESGTEVEEMETAEEEEQVQQKLVQEKRKGRKRKTTGEKREGPPVKK